MKGASIQAQAGCSPSLRDIQSLEMLSLFCLFVCLLLYFIFCYYLFAPSRDLGLGTKQSPPVQLSQQRERLVIAPRCTRSDQCCGIEWQAGVSRLGAHSLCLQHHREIPVLSLFTEGQLLDSKNTTLSSLVTSQGYGDSMIHSTKLLRALMIICIIILIMYCVK